MKSSQASAPSMTVKATVNNPRIEEMRLKIMDVLKGYEDISQTEVLAVLATMTGMVLALQDRKLPVAAYTEMISRNIELGNRKALSELASVEGAFKNV